MGIFVTKYIHVFSTLFEKWQSMVDNLYTKIRPLHKPFKEVNHETVSMLEEKNLPCYDNYLLFAFI